MLKQVVSKVYERLRLLYGVTYNTEYALSDELLKQLYNVHQGERCFVIGTGPSLNKTNFARIKDEVLFGTNKLYLDTKRFGIAPQYWCVADPDLFWTIHPEVLKLETCLFLTDGAAQRFLQNKSAFMSYHDDYFEPIVTRPLSDMKTSMEFSENALDGINGGMVTLSCLQLAFFMGFKEVYLVGCDCTSKGSHSYETSNVQGNDDWDILFKTYEVCKKVYEENGRKIYNATVGGKLEVFERVKLEDLKLNDKIIYIGQSEYDSWHPSGRS